MAAWFDKAASMGLDNMASPISTVPVNMGAWVYPISTGTTQCVFSCTTAGSGLNYVTLYQASGNLWSIEKTGGTVNTCGSAVLNAWQYILLRAVSATSIRCHILHPSGAITHATNTSAGAMTGWDTFSLGDFIFNTGAPTNFFSGGIGEFWYSNGDCYPQGAVEDGFLRELAYKGPLAMPTIRRSLIEYKTLRSDVLRGSGEEVHFGGRAQQTWTNTNGVLAGPHPPQPPGYNQIRPIPNLLTV